MTFSKLPHLGGKQYNEISLFHQVRASIVGVRAGLREQVREVIIIIIIRLFWAELD